jgi:16S rRNA (cytosine967-C5)-methyltransferase
LSAGRAADPAPGKPARALAARVLARVWTDDAFAAAALDAEMAREAGLDPRDAGLSTELVYGVLRTAPFLEETIARFAKRRTYAADPLVRAHVLIAAYSLLFLDRVPAFAAVNEAVSGVRAAAGERVAGFANALLRRLAAEDAARPSLGRAIASSAPGWLRGALRRSLGRAGAEAYLSAGAIVTPEQQRVLPPPIGLAVARPEARSRWLAELGAAVPRASFEPGGVSPHAILVRGAGDVRKLAGFGEAWIVQEEGAQLLALAVAPAPGERVLDACAGRGNKAWLLAGASPSALDAADLHPAKLEALRSGPAAPLVRETFAVDWTVGTGDVPDGYDRALVDAPCSGVGTMRRRPEIAQKREASDLERLAELQTRIARRVASRVREGGRLFYAVCSVLDEEGSRVASRLAEPDPECGIRLEPAPFDSELASRLAGGGTSLRLLPHVHGTDGYFIASFIVSRSP